MDHNFIDTISGFVRSKFVPRKRKVRFLESELYASSVTLKNIASASKEAPLSADYIFSVLLENSNSLKPVYQEMITLYRKKQTEEAFKYFADTLGTKLAKNLSIIFSKLDQLDPYELYAQMEVFQKMAEEERMTMAMKEVERRSVTVTVLSTATMFSLIINFAIVGVFLDTLAMLESIF